MLLLGRVFFRTLLEGYLVLSHGISKLEIFELEFYNVFHFFAHQAFFENNPMDFLGQTRQRTRTYISTRMPSKVDDLRSDLGLWKKRGGLCKVGPESSHSRAVISVIRCYKPYKWRKIYMGFTGVKFHTTCRSYNSTYGRMLGGSSQLGNS